TRAESITSTSGGWLGAERSTPRTSTGTGCRCTAPRPPRCSSTTPSRSRPSTPSVRSTRSTTARWPRWDADGAHVFGRSRKAVGARTAGDLDAMEAAGRIVGRALVAVRDAAVPGATTADLDAVADQLIRDAGAGPSLQV